jgi:S-adenosylmethionine hydrolase
MNTMPIISLLTDFGERDGFVGTMKGVILGICPSAQIVDITHEVASQNVLEGALALWRAAPFFPPGTVHVAVVDPGVGTRRRPLAARLGEHFFVGPDNGLFTPLIEAAERAGQALEIVHLTEPRYWLPGISRTFHGRDIFSPCGAHLANGVPLTALGAAIHDPLRPELPRPRQTESGWRAQVLIVDKFGNLATNLPAAGLPKDAVIHIAGTTVRGLVGSYGERSPGEIVALVDSEGYLEVAQVNGSAAAALSARVGTEVLVDI